MLAEPMLPGWSSPAVVLLVAGVGGGLVRFSRRRLAASRDRFTELQKAQEETMRRAVEEERARIAAELHDVVTHNVSVMVIQAGAARKVMDAAPERSKEALLAVEAGGRAAMAELRHVMGLLAAPDIGRADSPADGLEPQPGLGQLDWTSLAPFARRHNVGAVIVASASEDAKTVQMVQISATGRAPFSFAYAQSTFPALAEVIAEKAAEIWKTRVSVDFATRARLTADVSFESLDDWAKIRDGLGSIRAVTGLEVVGLALHEAEINVTYSGRQEQLRDALAQQNLQLSNSNGQFSLQIAGATAANSQ